MMEGLAEVLAVQGLDIAIEQANHRLTHLPEIDRRRECMESVASLERAIAELDRRSADAVLTLAASEREAADIETKVRRLESQLKTVIAPREAEALQHEIATLNEARGECDERGLEALEDAEQSDAERTKKESELAASRTALETILTELRIAQEVIQAEIGQLASRRNATASVAPAQLLAKYESRRKQSNRVAIAELIGAACGGCHLDLSQAERDQLRRLLDDEIPECPHCGCMLVV
jgi:predicted  nucleic acid-binding Zn-ribbon protein